MAWETHNREDALSLAKSMYSRGKRTSLIRQMLINDGLTQEEAEEILREASESAQESNSVSDGSQNLDE